MEGYLEPKCERSLTLPRQ